MKTIAMKGIIIPLFITLLCLILLVPIKIMAQVNQVKNTKIVRVERAMVIDQGKLNAKLTDEQKAKIKDLRVAHMKAVQLLKAQSQEIAAHLKTLNLADKPDNKAIFKTIDELVAIRGDIMKSNITFKQSIKAILTPEQFKELQLRFLNKRGEMGGRNQNWKRQGNSNFGRGQMMQRGGMNRPGQMMQRGQMRQGGMRPQGPMMNRQGSGFGGGQMMPQGQMQKRFQVIRQGQPNVPDTTKIK